MNQTTRVLIRLGKTEAAAASPDELLGNSNLSKFYFPGRGVIGSVIIHVLAIILIFFLPMLKIYLRPIPSPEKIVFIDLSSPRTVMYLPPLQGNQAEPAPKSKETQSESNKPAPTAGTEGLSYPGLQPILSDVPETTNTIQTILQPEVENPPTLVPPLPVPNMVQTEKTPMVVQAPQEQAVEPDLALPELEPVPLERMRARDLTRPDSLPTAEIPELSDNFPSMDIPDLVRTDVEPEMVLPEPETTPIERLRRSGKVAPSNQPAPIVQKPTGSFPLVDIPDLVRTGVEPEMTLPEPETAPIERLRRSTKVAPSSQPAPEVQKPTGSFPSVDIPDLVRTNVEPEMALSKPETAPIERLRRSGRSIPLSRQEAIVPATETPRPETQMPDLVRVPQPSPIPPDTPESQTQGTVEGERFLTLTPIPSLPAAELEIPEGEARGRFAISPEPNLSAPDQKPGIKPKQGPEEVQTEPPPLEIISLGTGTDPGPEIFVVNGTGDFSSADGNADSSDLTIRTFTGAGDNAFAGVTILSGTDPANSDSTVTILNTDENSTEGVTVIAGGQMPEDGPDIVPSGRFSRPLQTYYSLSVVSTENSGGGLPSYGVFDNDWIYTVYLDMRQTELEQDPSWILEFGLLDDPEDSPVVSLDQNISAEGLNLPFPAKKTRPVFPEEPVRKHFGKKIVINGVINTYGKIENLTILDSPDNTLSDAVLRSLHNWVFRSASLNGEPVAVKFLIGIPLWLPEGPLR